MSKSSADYLRDMLQELDDVTAFTADGQAAFMADLKTQKAVIRTYEVIGEIAKRLPAELRAANPPGGLAQADHLPRLSRSQL